MIFGYGKYGISMVLGMETKILVWKYGFFYGVVWILYGLC